VTKSGHCLYGDNHAECLTKILKFLKLNKFITEDKQMKESEL